MSWVTKPPLHIRGDYFRWSLISTYSSAVSNTVICLPFRPGVYKYHVAGHHGDEILYGDNNILRSSVRNLSRVKIWRLEFWDGSLILGKCVHLCYRPIQSWMEGAWAKYFSSHLWIFQSILIFPQLIKLSSSLLSSTKNYIHFHNIWQDKNWTAHHCVSFLHAVKHTTAAAVNLSEYSKGREVSARMY